jgi:hypothetical protein
MAQVFGAADIEINVCNRVPHQDIKQHIGLDYRLLPALRVAQLLIDVPFIVVNE